LPDAPSLALALLADARLPVGGHTQSSGLEPAVRAGLRLEAVPALIEARLTTVIPTDAATAVVARRCLVDGAGGSRVGDADDGGAPAGGVGGGSRVGGSDDGGGAQGVWRVWLAWAARTPSPVLRAQAEQAGRGRLRLAEALWPGRPEVRAARGAQALAAASRGGGPAHLPRPLAFGVEAACAGLDAVSTACLVAYDDIATLTGACAKLLPADPTVVAGWLAAALPRMEALAGRLAHLTDPADIPDHSAPQLDVWAAAHARQRERLFHA
jgi:urease accessory protein